MRTMAAVLPFGKQELSVKLLFYSSSEQRAHRLAARLRNIATVDREEHHKFAPERWTGEPSEYRLVLLDYAGEDAERSTALAHRFGTLAHGPSLIGVGSTAAEHAAGVLAALRAGVRDFIDMDAADEEIDTLLEHALEHAAASHAAPAPTTRRPGQLALLLGVRPGVGTSTLAAHLGALSMPPQAVAEDAAALHTLLLDLGQPHGDAALYLGAKGDFHYEDALRDAERVDTTLVRTALPRHASRLAVLAQAQESPVHGVEAAPLLERLREIFELTLCDLGGVPCRQVPRDLLHAADEIWLVADQGIASMVSLDACLRQLPSLHARERRLSLIVNRYDEECGIAAQQIAERFEVPLLATLPDRGRALRSSANQGLLLHQVAPHDAYVRALAPLLARLHIHVQGNAESLGWRRLFHRHGEHR